MAVVIHGRHPPSFGLAAALTQLKSVRGVAFRLIEIIPFIQHGRQGHLNHADGGQVFKA